MAYEHINFTKGQVLKADDLNVMGQAIENNGQDIEQLKNRPMPTGVGKAEGTKEIFNDYENNMALGGYSHAEGSNIGVTVGVELLDEAEKIYKVIFPEGMTIDNLNQTHFVALSEETQDGDNIKTYASKGTRIKYADGECEIVAAKDNNEDELLLTFNQLIPNGDITIVGYGATGETSHVENIRASAIGDYSHAEGRNTIAGGNDSHAEGRATLAAGIQSHAEGRWTRALGKGSHAEGGYTEASHVYAHAEGGSTKATGEYSHAEGGTTTASGNYSHAEGHTTVASGLHSHAEGFQAKASGKRSHAEGADTEASGECAHAEGDNTKATGNRSHAEGYNTQAKNFCSHAEGNNTIADSNMQHVMGTWNQTGTGHPFVIGWGTQDERKNIFSIDTEGRLYLTDEAIAALKTALGIS